MAINNNKQTQPLNDAEKHQKEVKSVLKTAKDDPSVKQALKKEKQPGSIEDLSPIHNTKSVGTSGGDQRASKDEAEQADKDGEGAH